MSQWLLSPSEMTGKETNIPEPVWYRAPKERSKTTSKGTFKPLCIRGHIRKGNVDAKGHCLDCRKLWAVITADNKKEKSLVFKPFCKYGHPRRDNLTKDGHCRTCAKESAGRGKYGKVGGWKRNGVKNKDGSQFMVADFDLAYKNQDGKCFGCSRHSSIFKKALIADHDHATGFFRGLLCFQCNFILGQARDTSEILRRLASYLEAAR